MIRHPGSSIFTKERNIQSLADIIAFGGTYTVIHCKKLLERIVYKEMLPGTYAIENGSAQNIC